MANASLFQRKCAQHDLLITNTVFRQPNRNKTLWMHPRSKHCHLNDYVVVRRKDRQDVKVTKTMCGADCWTDLRLVVSKLNLRIQLARRPEGKKAPKRLDVSQLNNKRQAFLNDTCSHLGAMQLSSEKRTGQSFETRFTLHLLIPYDIHLANAKTGLTRMMMEFRVFLTQYPRRQPATTSVGQSRADSETCRSHG